MEMINHSASAISENQTGVSEDERLRYLQHLQEETTLSMVPAMTFLLVLGAVGLVGNTAVLFVYTRKLRTNSVRVLIRVIAVFDLVANVCAIPGEIYDMFHTWDFENRGLCRARLFVNAFVTLSTGLALLVVAVVRYRKVCHPYRWQITVTQAKIISVIIAFLGALLATPYAVINGRQTKATPRSDITAYECASDDEYKDTHWPVVNNAFFLLLFLSSCVSLTVLYVRIGTTAKIIGTAATFSHEPKNVSYPDFEDPNFQRSDEEIICPDCNVKTQGSNEEIASPDCRPMDSKFQRSNEEIASPDCMEPKFERPNEEIICPECNVKTQRSNEEIASPDCMDREFQRCDFTSKAEDDRENTCVQSSKSGKHNMSSTTSNDPRKSTIEPPVAKSATVEASVLNCKKPQEYQNFDIESKISYNNMADKVSTKRTDYSIYNISQGSNSNNRKNTQITQISDRLKIFTDKEADKSKTVSGKPRNGRKSLGRMTAMLIIISAVYVVGFLPYLALSFFEFIAPDEYSSLNLRELAAYNFFLRFYFLNSAANPIIYSLCGVNFRKECLKLFWLQSKVKSRKIQYRSGVRR